MAITSTRAAAVVPPVTASSAYAANNVVGGILHFPNMLGIAQSGVVLSAWLQMKSAQTAEFDLYLFDALPTGTFADKGGAAIAAADVPHCIGRIQFPATAALSELGSNHTLYEANGVAKAIAPGVRDLYGVLITKGTPTFGSVSDVTVNLGTLADVT